MYVQKVYNESDMLIWREELLVDRICDRFQFSYQKNSSAMMNLILDKMFHLQNHLSYVIVQNYLTKL